MQARALRAQSTIEASLDFDVTLVVIQREPEIGSRLVQRGQALVRIRRPTQIAQLFCLHQRRTKDGHPFVTDSGNWILDAALERIAEPESLAQRLSAIPGVVEHGLFIHLAQTAIIAGPDGVRIVERS